MHRTETAMLVVFGLLMFVFGLLMFVIGMLSTGCSSITSPEPVYTCITQPRPYVRKDTLQVEYLTDTYTQSVPCPTIPIK